MAGGFGRDIELGTNFLVGESTREKTEYFDFTIGESAGSVRRAHGVSGCVEDRGDGIWTEQTLSCHCCHVRGGLIGAEGRSMWALFAQGSIDVGGGEHACGG